MEQVILVNDSDEQTGVMEKMEAHQKGLLHRAFSIFIFNDRHEMLLQQRAATKYHSAGLWTNACCSHPRPGETTINAANRRLHEELGFTTLLTEVFNFTYKAAFENGLTEHELDYVFTGIFNGEIIPNPAEVQNYAYVPLDKLSKDLVKNPGNYTAWFAIAFPKVQKWLTTAMLL